MCASSRQPGVRVHAVRASAQSCTHRRLLAGRPATRASPSEAFFRQGIALASKKAVERLVADYSRKSCPPLNVACGPTDALYKTIRLSVCSAAWTDSGTAVTPAPSLSLVSISRKCCSSPRQPILPAPHRGAGEATRELGCSDQVGWSGGGTWGRAESSLGRAGATEGDEPPDNASASQGAAGERRVGRVRELLAKCGFQRS